MGIEVIHHQDDRLGIRIAMIDQVLDLVCPVALGPMVSHVNPAVPGEWRTEEEAVDDAPALILVVLARNVPLRQRQRRPDVAEQLLGDLVHADQGAARIIRAGVDVQDVFHAPHELTILMRWNAPLPPQMRLELVFFRIRRTVWYETSSTTSSSTSLSASSRRLQRACPAGGVLHASATNRASCSPSSL